ncbi:MAG: hypothetical protein MJY56_04520 [Bacteroidales bacterium]|nr:hypothetical protein [Bacteroidales bacterium]
MFTSAMLAAVLLSACTPEAPVTPPPKPKEEIPATHLMRIDASAPGATIPNLASNVNLWDMGRTFINPEIPTGKVNIMNFVEYFQLMTATGGNSSRDLFRNPKDMTVLDDYKFDNLIENCRGILALGAKPHIKLGNVPQKLATDYYTGTFGVNVYPPKDYPQYYKYIRAIIEALVSEFGLDEVKTWHFGVYTEYENSDWFWGLEKSAKSGEEEFCKIYDWTTQAVTDVLGPEAYIGAHSMTVTAGLWDERNFIKHCAEGTNYANGGKGTHISYLSSSFYDSSPGHFTSGLSLYDCISFLKSTAEKYGLNNLVYGVDEGRILGATKGSAKSDLYSRIVGFTYMAAYDARLYLQMLEAGGSYLSSWYYLSDSLLEGNPSMSFHVANNLHNMAGMNRLPITTSVKKVVPDAEVRGLAGVDPTTGKTMVMVYNFYNSLSYDKEVAVKLEIETGLQGKHKLIKSRIDDDCNWFDEWVEDRKKAGIGNDDCSWSPDDPCCVPAFANSKARELFEENHDKYRKCSTLYPEKANITIGEDGLVETTVVLPPNTVCFIEIE